MLSVTLGWVATILFTICYIPQITKMLKTKEVEDVSSGFFAISFTGNVIALIYAIMINQPPLILKYVLGLVLSLVVLYYYFKFKKHGRN